MNEEPCGLFFEIRKIINHLLIFNELEKYGLFFLIFQIYEKFYFFFYEKKYIEYSFVIKNSV